MYAWVATVALPAFAQRAPWGARVAAMGALLALAVGLLGRKIDDSAIRFLRGSGFFVLSGATWVLLGKARMMDMEPIQSAFGGLGWALCAFGWGKVRNPRSVPEEDPRAVSGAPLAARRRLPLRAMVYFGTTVLLAGIVFVLSWVSVRSSVVILAELLALAVAAWLTVLGARLAHFATDYNAWDTPGARLRAPARPLALLAVLVLGAILAESLLR